MPYVASPMLIGDKRNFFGRLSGVVEQDQRYERGVSTEDREIEPITCEGQSERKRLASFGPESYLLNPKVLYQGHSANGCTIRDKSRSKLTHPRVKGLIQVNRVPIRSNVLGQLPQRPRHLEVPDERRSPQDFLLCCGTWQAPGKQEPGSGKRLDGA